MVNISFVFWAMEFQEKMLLGFTDLYHVFSSKESMYLDHLFMDFIIYIGIDNRKSLKTKVKMHFTGLKSIRLLYFLFLPLGLALSTLHKFTIAIRFNLDSKVEVAL